jgi:hypothetical protein
VFLHMISARISETVLMTYAERLDKRLTSAVCR